MEFKIGDEIKFARTGVQISRYRDAYNTLTDIVERTVIGQHTGTVLESMLFPSPPHKYLILVKNENGTLKGFTWAHDYEIESIHAD